MSKIALATAVVALTTAVLLMMGRTEAQQLVPGAAPPWSTTTTTTTATATATATETTTSETKPVLTPAATLAPQPQRTSVQPGATTPIPGAAPIQGTTTPIQAVFLRSGPSTSAPVIGTLQPGVAVQVRATANYGWTQVETPAGSGWTYGSYLAPAGGAVAVQDPAPTQETIVR